MRTVIETVPQTPGEKQAKREELLARAAALGWSQNKLARRAGYKNPGFISGVLTGKVNSPGVWPRLERALRKIERRRRVHA
jgi:transcriptional regulator with XRE-family HTH domain